MLDQPTTLGLRGISEYIPDLVTLYNISLEALALEVDGPRPRRLDISA